MVLMVADKTNRVIITFQEFQEMINVTTVSEALCHLVIVCILRHKTYLVQVCKNDKVRANTQALDF